MPLNPMVLSALISTGSRLLGGYLGRGQSEWGLGSEQQALLRHLQQKRAGGIPSWMRADISDPFARLGKLIKQQYARQPGSSGLMPAVMRRQVTAPQSRALSRAGTQWEMGIDQQIASLLGGTGTYKQGTDWGGVATGAGGDITFLMGLMEALKSDQQAIPAPRRWE